MVCRLSGFAQLWKPGAQLLSAQTSYSLQPQSSPVRVASTPGPLTKIALDAITAPPRPLWTYEITYTSVWVVPPSDTLNAQELEPSIEISNPPTLDPALGLPEV